MDENNRNFILAIILSIGVLFTWQMFFAPKPHPQNGGTPTAEQQTVPPGPPQAPAQGETPVTPGAGAGTVPAAPGGGVATLTREEALAQSPRVKIDTPSLEGSIALKGGRIDDLVLKKYRETVEPTSPNVVLLSPSGSPHPYYAEHGFVGSGKEEGLPNGDTLWTATSQGPLTPQAPVTLTYDNGKGLVFTRIISVDDNYMFTIDDKVANSGGAAVALYPYGLVSRHERPADAGLLHPA